MSDIISYSKFRYELEYCDNDYIDEFKALYDRACEYYELREHIDLFKEDVNEIGITINKIDGVLRFLKEEFDREEDDRETELFDSSISFCRIHFSNIKKALQEEVAKVSGICNVGQSLNLNQDFDSLSSEEKLTLISELKEQQAAISAKITELIQKI